MTVNSLQTPVMPPHDTEAEQAVLGAILLRPDVLTTVADFIDEQDFYDHPQRLIFAAMRRLDDAGRAIDHITISDE